MHNSRHGEKTQRRATLIAGIALSVLLHAIGLWLLIYSSHSIIKPPPLSGQERIIVSLLPTPSSVPTPPPSKPTPPPALAPAPTQPPAPPAPPLAATPPKPSAPRPPEHARVRKPPPKEQVHKPALARNTVPKHMEKSPPPVAPADVPRRDMSVPDDMFTQLEATRKRRAETLGAQPALPANNAAPAEKASSRDNSVAMANIAESLNRAYSAGRDRNGGVFQIRRLGPHDAEFSFHGWSANSRRESSRLITVDQGAEIDIQTAVVKKMIEIIREQQREDFIWVSDRLGREVTLSARPQDSVELQRFLLREFFPDYVRLGQR